MVGSSLGFASALATILLCIGCAQAYNAFQTRQSLAENEKSWVLCFQCNSEYDPRCGDPFDPYSLGTVNCSLINPLEHLPGVRPRMCRKNVQRIYGKVRIVRSCGYIEDDSVDSKCLYRSGTHNVNAQYCSCTGDLCNSSSRTAISLAIVLGFLPFSSLL